LTCYWKASFELSWNNEETSGGATTTGGLTVAAGVEADIGRKGESEEDSYTIIDVDGHIETTVELQAKLEVTSAPEITVDCTGTWKPLAIVVSLKLFHGWIRPYEGTWTLMPDRTCHFGTLTFSAESE
jgi:hypothetical protein